MQISAHSLPLWATTTLLFSVEDVPPIHSSWVRPCLALSLQGRSLKHWVSDALDLSPLSFLLAQDEADNISQEDAYACRAVCPFSFSELSSLSVAPCPQVLNAAKLEDS